MDRVGACIGADGDLITAEVLVGDNRSTYGPAHSAVGSGIKYGSIERACRARRRAVITTKQRASKRDDSRDDKRHDDDGYDDRNDSGI